MARLRDRDGRGEFDAEPTSHGRRAHLAHPEEVEHLRVLSHDHGGGGRLRFIPFTTRWTVDSPRPTSAMIWLWVRPSRKSWRMARRSSAVTFEGFR